MAQIKKNQMTQILFPIVDGTDFATVESGITASNFESKMTKKFFGVNHGISTAFTSGTISKAATLVRSGIFQQTLKAAETNYDYVLYAFIPNNASLAEQILVFNTVDYDQSDLMSRISDVGSDLRSYLVGMSGALSDVESQVDLLATSDYLSAVHSDLASAIGGVTASVSVSDMSDIASRVWATTEGTRVDSRILVIQSLVSDVESQVDLLATSNYLSALHSDLYSAIGGVTATLTASDISDIASAVWAADHSVLGAGASSFGSLIKIMGSTVSDTYSFVSDVDSALTVHDANLSDQVSNVQSYLVAMSGALSDVESQVDLLATSDYLSQVESNLHSAIGNVSVTLTASDISDIASATAAAITTIDASDISDIASAVWAQHYVAHSNVSSFGSFLRDVMYSLLSDVESQLDSTDASLDSQFLLNLSAVSDAISAATAARSAALLAASNASDAHSLTLFAATYNASLISDIQSMLDSQFAYVSGALSDMHSDLGSQIGGITAGIDASDISDIASRVWSEKYTAHSAASSFGSLMKDGIYSLLSDVDSQVTANYNFISDVDSALTLHDANISGMISDLDSQVLLNASMISDIDSQIDAGVTITASSLSDIYSRIWDTAEAEVSSMPAANAGYGDKLNMMFAALRNKRTTTGSKDKIFDDAGTSNIASAVLNDDATTFTRDEYS